MIAACLMIVELELISIVSRSARMCIYVNVRYKILYAWKYEQLDTQMKKKTACKF